MNFSTDRDLLVIEPSVFADCVFAAQQRISVADGVLTDTTLSSATADFADAGVDTGDVVLVNQVACEVISRTDAQTLEVSLPRARLSDAAIPPLGEGTGLTIVARTFQPQAALVRDGLLRLLGIDVDDPEATLDEDSVISLTLMARLEALGTLERIYSAAVALGGDNTVLSSKAQAYRNRFREAMRSATILIDTNGDGYADEKRHLGLIRMTRV